MLFALGADLCTVEWSQKEPSWATTAKCPANTANCLLYVCGGWAGIECKIIPSGQRMAWKVVSYFFKHSLSMHPRLS